MTTSKLKRLDAVQLTAELFRVCPSSVPALELAAYAHEGQFRKETRDGVSYADPYVTHPIRNALRVLRLCSASMSATECLHLASASLLHDTVEDAPRRVMSFYRECDIGLPEARVRECAHTLIGEVFGSRVQDTVWRVTNPVGTTLPYVEHIRSCVVNDEFSWLTKMSDLTDNAGSLRHMAPSPRRYKLAQRYTEPVQVMLDYAGVVRPTVRVTVRQRLEVIALDLAGIVENGI